MRKLLLNALFVVYLFLACVFLLSSGQKAQASFEFSFAAQLYYLPLAAVLGGVLLRLDAFISFCQNKKQQALYICLPHLLFAVLLLILSFQYFLMFQVFPTVNPGIFLTFSHSLFPLYPICGFAGGVLLLDSFQRRQQ